MGCGLWERLASLFYCWGAKSKDFFVLSGLEVVRHSFGHSSHQEPHAFLKWPFFKPRATCISQMAILHTKSHMHFSKKKCYTDLNKTWNKLMKKRIQGGRSNHFGGLKRNFNLFGQGISNISHSLTNYK